MTADQLASIDRLARRPMPVEIDRRFVRSLRLRPADEPLPPALAVRLDDLSRRYFGSGPAAPDPRTL